MTARPTCAVCGRPVDSFTEEEGDEDVVWVARCHGKSERIRLQKSQLAHSKVTGLGLAFAGETRRLGASPWERAFGDKTQAQMAAEIFMKAFDPEFRRQLLEGTWDTGDES